MKIGKTIYWITTLTLCAVMLFSAIMYFSKYETIAEIFESLGYPTHIIYPLAIAKILGVLAILIRKSKLLKEWAYAGFFFDTSLAVHAHIQVSDGGELLAFAALGLVIISRIFENSAFKR